MHRRGGQAGFTLIELLIVVGVLGILTAVLVPNFVRARGAGHLAACQIDLRNVAAALEIYYGENQIYPAAASWQTDLTGGAYMRSVPQSPIDRASYGYATDAGRTTFVLWDGPSKYGQAGVNGYVVYTAAGGIQIDLPSVPSP